MRKKVFFDCEFTGLYQDTSLISIGFIAESGETFYAELTDYNLVDLVDWIQVNVIDNLLFNDCNIEFTHIDHINKTTEIKGDNDSLKIELLSWLEKLGDVEMWSDLYAYDWVLFNNIFGGAMDIPKNVYYIPFDICTQFKLAGIDPDINREEFSGMKEGARKHNALWDAMVIKACYERLVGVNDFTKQNKKPVAT